MVATHDNFNFETAPFSVFSNSNLWVSIVTDMFGTPTAPNHHFLFARYLVGTAMESLWQLNNYEGSA